MFSDLVRQVWVGCEDADVRWPVYDKCVDRASPFLGGWVPQHDPTSSSPVGAPSSFIADTDGLCRKRSHTAERQGAPETRSSTTDLREPASITNTPCVVPISSDDGCPSAVKPAPVRRQPPPSQPFPPSYACCCTRVSARSSLSTTASHALPIQRFLRAQIPGSLNCKSPAESRSSMSSAQVTNTPADIRLCTTKTPGTEKNQELSLPHKASAPPITQSNLRGCNATSRLISSPIHPLTQLLAASEPKTSTTMTAPPPSPVRAQYVLRGHATCTLEVRRTLCAMIKLYRTGKSMYDASFISSMVYLTPSVRMQVKWSPPNPKPSHDHGRFVDKPQRSQPLLWLCVSEPSRASKPHPWCTVQPTIVLPKCTLHCANPSYRVNLCLHLHTPHATYTGFPNGSAAKILPMTDTFGSRLLKPPA